MLEQARAAFFSLSEGSKKKQNTDAPFGLCFIVGLRSLFKLIPMSIII